MTLRGPYLLSGLGHALGMALLVATASLSRAPIVVPRVHLALGTPAGTTRSAVREATPGPAPAPAREEPKVEPAPPVRPVEDPVLNAPPERRPGAPDPMGMQPPSDAGMVSKIPGKPKPVPAETAETAEMDPEAGSGAGRRGVGAEAEGDAGAASGYLALLQERVAMAWQPPPSVGRSGQVRTVVRFFISRNGGPPMQLEVETPSQVPLFDRAALRAVFDAAPLPPLPSHLELDSIGIRFTFYQDY